MTDQVTRIPPAVCQVLPMVLSQQEPQGMPFHNLPTEILMAIIEQADFGDLKALNLVSRSFYSHASRRLFKTLKFWVSEHDFNVAPPLAIRMREDLLASRSLRFMKLVKAIQFRAPVVRNFYWGDRCGYDIRSFWRLGSPTPNIVQLFEQLEKDSLRSFDWQLATCIPDGILSDGILSDGILSDGILSDGSCLVEEQSAIETMALNTFCCSENHPRKPYVLTNFKRIHSFSWIGLEELVDVKAARDFLRSNRKILQHLELNFIYWRDERSSDRNPIDSVDFASYVLPRGNDNLIQEFQSLRSLSLTQASLTGALLEASALNISQLRSLKLHHCVNTPKFLHAVATAETPLTLSNLELSMQDHIEAEWTGSALTRFLESFQGLEELHILVDPACPALRYWQAAANHKSTLRNFAYHERVRGDDGFWCVDQYFGSGDYQYGPLRREHQFEMLLDCSLDCLGYCDSSREVEVDFQSHHSELKPFTFKLLHIRCSAEELDLKFQAFFAHVMTKGEQRFDLEWMLEEHYALILCVQSAFTSEHLPQLQIMAFGDFSYDGRFRDRHFLFCREAKPNSDFAFRVMERSDRADGIGTGQPFGLAEHEMVHFEGIHQPFEFLAACPAETFASCR